MSERLNFSDSALVLRVLPTSFQAYPKPPSHEQRQSEFDQTKSRHSRLLRTSGRILALTVATGARLRCRAFIERSIGRRLVPGRWGRIA